jgi:peroxiredoxin
MGSNGLCVGDSAPAFELNPVDRAQPVRLADYVGRAPLFLNLLRGLQCPFCRRGLIQLVQTERKLRDLGVETLAVILTPRERAQMYFRYRPTSVPLASDPEARTHHNYGLVAFEVTEDQADWPYKVDKATVMATTIDPTREMDQPGPAPVVIAALNERDGYQFSPEDDAIQAAHGSQLEGRFLVDRDGILRWVHREAPDGIAGLGQAPSDDEVMSAARAMVG